VMVFEQAWAIVKGTPARPPGYGKGGILDPSRIPKPPIGTNKRRKKVEVDEPELLEENEKKLSTKTEKSTSNLLFALGLLQK